MRRLILVNTYFQLIFVAQIRNTLFMGDQVTLLISDHSIGADDIAEKLSDYNFFTKVIFIKTYGAKNERTLLQRIRDAYDICFSDKNRYSIYIEGADEAYDEFLSFNYTIETIALFALLSSKNPSIKYSRFEEGILTYNSYKMHNFKRNIIKIGRLIQGKPVIERAYSNFYCFYPHLYKGTLIPIKVDLIARESPIIPMLCDVFGVGSEPVKYKEKYIYFASVYDFEGGKPVGEFELVKELGSRVGIENIIVKMHPRDRRNVYTEAGFKVDKNSRVPWEILLMNGDFSDNVFLTINSTSVIASNLILSEKYTGYYLYRLCDISGNSSAIDNSKTIENLLQDKKLSDQLISVKIVDKLEDI